MTAHNIHVKGGNCTECDFPLDEFGDCTNSDCDTNLVSEHDLLDEKDNHPEDEDTLAYDDMFNDERDDEDDTDELELGGVD